MCFGAVCAVVSLSFLIFCVVRFGFIADCADMDSEVFRIVVALTSEFSLFTPHTESVFVLPVPPPLPNAPPRLCADQLVSVLWGLSFPADVFEAADDIVA